MTTTIVLILNLAAICATALYILILAGALFSERKGAGVVSQEVEIWSFSPMKRSLSNQCVARRRCLS